MSSKVRDDSTAIGFESPIADEIWLLEVAETVRSAFESASVAASLHSLEPNPHLVCRPRLAADSARDDAASERGGRFVVARCVSERRESCVLAIVIHRPRHIDARLLRHVVAHLEASLLESLERRDVSAIAARARDIRPLLRESTRRLDAIDSVTLGRAIEAGAWSLVARSVLGEQETLLARADNVSVDELPRLDDRERDVLARVAAGQANKCIAAELDLPVSSVARILRRSLSLVGVHDRAGRTALFSALRARLATRGGRADGERHLVP